MPAGTTSDQHLRRGVEVAPRRRAEYFLAHATAWATLAAMLAGRWDEVLALGDSLLAMREEVSTPVGASSLFRGGRRQSALPPHAWTRRGLRSIEVHSRRLPRWTC